MGTASTTKHLKHVNGTLTEDTLLTTSAGAGDKQKGVATNDSGFLDPTLLNAKNTSAGAADAAKLVQLDPTGRLDASMLPVGIGPDTASILTSEALAAGNFVNVYNNAGTANARKADATTSGKHTHGFVLAAFASGVAATVYFEGTNTAVTGLTPGDQFLSITAGGSSVTAPTASGNVVQRLGVATSATSLNFEAAQPIVLA